MSAKHPVMNHTLPWQDDSYGGAVAHRTDGSCSYVISTAPKVRGGFDLHSHKLGSNGRAVRVPLGHYQTLAEAKARAEQHYAVTAHRTGG
jgi:hypothetical protein